MSRLALIVCVLLGSQVRADEPKTDPAKELEGEWRVESVDLGKLAPKVEQELAEKNFVGKVRMTFRDKKMLTSSGPKEKDRQVSYRVAADPKANGLFLTLLEGEDKGKEFPFALFRVEKDKLTLCMNTHKDAKKLPGKLEPSEKDEASGDTTVVLVLKRVPAQK